MIIQSLNENWSMEISGKPGSYPVQVPGSVYSALLEAGYREYRRIGASPGEVGKVRQMVPQTE